MKKIERKEYLEKLIKTIDTQDIKIITGVRRSGKSSLLEDFKDYIGENIKDNNIMHLNFSLIKNEPLLEYNALNDYVVNSYDENKINFLLIDEIQMCENFEKVINSLHAENKYKIYLTGSNAFLLSSDLATLFTGRFFEIKVFPFSFKEFNLYYDFSNVYEAFEEYTLVGGFAGSYPYESNEEKYLYLNEIFNTMIIRDINQKYKIKNNLLIFNIFDFLLDNISNLTTSRNIEKILNNNPNKINHKTISNYLSYLCNAFVFYKLRRYDVQGKKYLVTQNKYYLVDHSLKFAKIGTKNMNYGCIYENIVAIELLRRGYELYIGVINNLEIDFVAIKKDEKIYIQVSDNIEAESTFNREVNSLLKIKDSYPKMIVARTKHDTYQYEGIKIIDIANFLINKDII